MSIAEPLQLNWYPCYKILYLISRTEEDARNITHMGKVNIVLISKSKTTNDTDIQKSCYWFSAMPNDLPPSNLHILNIKTILNQTPNVTFALPYWSWSYSKTHFTRQCDHNLDGCNQNLFSVLYRQKKNLFEQAEGKLKTKLNQTVKKMVGREHQWIICRTEALKFKSIHT